MRQVPLNVNAAATTRTDQLHPSGGLGLNLEGDGYTVGVWEANENPQYSGSSYILATHEQLAGRVYYGDFVGGYYSHHATHVAGTIAGTGAGADPATAGPARGMAPQVDLLNFTSTADLTEMRMFASQIEVSNHSYGLDFGWSVWAVDELNGILGTSFATQSGDIDLWPVDWAAEDHLFGKYLSGSAGLDDVLHDEPYFLSVWSGGNDRDDQFSNAGNDGTYVAFFLSDPWNGQNPQWQGPGYYQVNNGPTPAPPGDGNRGTGFDSMSSAALAKNSLSVGAVDDVDWANPNIVIAGFSSYGPTDDGRIKPDVVGNGVDLYSAIALADDAYDVMSGTSMAAPNVTGTAVQLIEHFNKEYDLPVGSPVASATTKGAIIHNAFDAGNEGPDYSYGWGVVDGAKAATFISNAATGYASHRLEQLNYSGTEWTREVVWDGVDPLRATIVWTDPAGQANTGGLDDAAPVLVNDLDVWITRETAPEEHDYYHPWKLDPANPANAATRYVGQSLETNYQNHRDNVEQVLIDAPLRGTYTVHVGHTGTLTGGSQDLSVMISGGYVAEFVIDAGLQADDTAPDTFVVTRNGNNLEVVVNGGPPQSIPIVGSGSLLLSGSEDNDTMTVYSLGTGVSRPIVLSGGTGLDVAKMYDSSGDDAVKGYPTQLTLTIQNGYSVRADDFAGAHVYAENGGTDVAHFYGSLGNDSFLGDRRSGNRQGILSGSGFWNRVKNFEQVYGHGGNSGNDAAVFHDSPGDDLFEADPTKATMSGEGFEYEAQSFETVVAYASGGNDTAKLYGSPQNDDFDAAAGVATMASLAGTWSNTAQNFETVYAYESPGDDTTDINWDNLGMTLVLDALYWDQQGDGEWGDLAAGWSNWHDWAGNDTKTFPQANETDAIVKTNTVTATEDRTANDLSVQSGTLAVAVEKTVSLAGQFIMGAEGTHTANVDRNESTPPSLVDVTGELQLAGTLAPAGHIYTGTWGQAAYGDRERTIISFNGTRQGEFTTEPTTYSPANYKDSHLGYGIFYDNSIITLYQPTTVVLGVIQAGRGDANGDYYFNFTDLANIFADSGAVYGNPNPDPPVVWTGGDFNGDGAFMFDDLSLAFAELGAFYGGDVYWPQQGAAAGGGGEGAAAAPTGGQQVRAPVTLVYDAATGRLRLDAGAEKLRTVLIESAAGLLAATSESAELTAGTGDVSKATRIGKAGLKQAFGDLDFGALLPAMLDRDALAKDLTVSGAYDGGGYLGEVRLVYLAQRSAELLTAAAADSAADSSSWAAWEFGLYEYERLLAGNRTSAAGAGSEQAVDLLLTTWP